MLRVAHIVPSLARADAGTSYSVPRLAAELIDLGTDQAVFCAGPKHEKTPTGPVIHFDQRYKNIPVIRNFLFDKNLEVLINDFNPDVIHNHGAWLWPNIKAAHVADRLGVPLVCSPRGMLGPGALKFSRQKKRLIWSLAQQSAFKSVARWHATSEKECTDIRAQGFSQPVSVIPNGVDVFDQAANSVGRRENTILFLGRIHPKKGVYELIKAWQGLGALTSGWTLKIVGDFETQYGLKCRREAVRTVQKNVSFVGPVYGAQKFREFRNAAVFILPTKDENFGITVAEALSQETPVICTKEAPWSGLREKNCGWWIDLTEHDLIQSLRTAILASDDDLQKMGRNGRLWSEREFSWASIAKKMIDAYSLEVNAAE